MFIRCRIVFLVMALTINRLRNKSSDKEAIKELILEHLRRSGKYREDLMYRGTHVDNEGLKRLRKYGTDRSEEGNDADTVPDKTCALPEQCLEHCIERYAFNFDEDRISVVVVYNPEYLIFDSPGHRCDGMPANQVPLNYKADDVMGHYKFKEGFTALDAAVAAFRLIRH